MQFDTDALRTLVAIADSGSFSLAAQRRHRVQSAISMQIRKLEDQVGQPLFKRSNRGVISTASGETLLAYARRILSLHDEAASKLGQLSLAGRVVIGTSENYASGSLTPALKACRHRYPKIGLEIICGYSRALWDGFASGEIDVVVAQDCPDNVTGRVLFSEPVLWVGSPDIQLDADQPLPLALFGDGCSDRRNALNSLDSIGRSYDVIYSSPSLAGLLEVVEAGLAISAVARSQIPDNLAILSDKALPALKPISISLAYKDLGVAASPAVVVANEVAERFRITPSAETHPVGSLDAIQVNR